MKILAIETSCDETGIALLEASGELRSPRFEVVKNLVSSQIKIHRPFGGVVPNLAKREHLKNLPILFERIKKQESRSKNRKLMIPDSKFMLHVDLITVTVGTSNRRSRTGIEFAKGLAKEYKKPIIGANHLEGHLYSFLLPPRNAAIPDTRYPIPDIFPAIALIVSGGHTILLRMESLSKWRRLGETRDDAAGEAFDKVARMMGLPYPGGPEIERIARLGNPAAIPFPRPMIHDKSYDFSFSGLKTAVLYYLRQFEELRIANCEFKKNPQSAQIGSGKSAIRNQTINKANIAASFQQAAIDVLVTKTLRARRTIRRQISYLVRRSRGKQGIEKLDAPSA